MTQEFRRLLTQGGFSPQQAETCAAYADLLLEANRTMNLTRITDEAEVARKHFLDSAAPLRLGLIAPGQAVLDIGCGAGFPGAVLAALGCTVTMVDAQRKKVDFVAEALQKAGIAATVRQGRAEELAREPLWREQWACVVSRAVAALPVLLELCGGFCAPGGRFLAYKGEQAAAEAKEAANAAAQLGLRLAAIHPAGVEGQAHHILEYRREGALPARYPRAFGKIKKAPL